MHQIGNILVTVFMIMMLIIIIITIIIIINAKPPFLLRVAHCLQCSAYFTMYVFILTYYKGQAQSVFEAEHTLSQRNCGFDFNNNNSKCKHTLTSQCNTINVCILI